MAQELQEFSRAAERAAIVRHDVDAKLMKTMAHNDLEKENEGQNRQNLLVGAKGRAKEAIFRYLSA